MPTLPSRFIAYFSSQAISPMSNLSRLIAAATLLPILSLPVIAQDATPPAPAADAAAAGTLTIEDCVRRALDRGFGIEIQRFSPSMAQDSVDIARSSFVPVLSASSTKTHENDAQTAKSLGSRSDDSSTKVGVSELLATGATVSISSTIARAVSNPASSSALYNPAYSSDLTLSVSQPLLKGAGSAVTKAALNKAKIGLDRARLDFKAQALDIVQETETAYYNLVSAREQLKVYNASLELANRLLDEAREKKTVGTATDIDVLEAQVGVANARSNVIQSEKTVKDSADSLLALIGRFELDTQLGATRFEDFTGQTPVIESSYQLALRNQPDYLSSKLQLEQLKIAVASAKDGLKPTLNVEGALGFNGYRGSGEDSFNSAVNRDNNTWELGLTLSYPWGNVGNKATYRQSVSTLNQQALTVRQLEQSILVKVRSAVRAVETNVEKVKIAALAADYSSRQYDLERARFDAGLATSREVLQTQTNLEDARLSVLQARITLQTSISSLHRLEGSSLERYQIALQE